MLMPTPSMTPLSVLYLLGMAQAIFLAISLLTAKKGKRRANLYLALLLLLFAIDLSNEFLESSLYGLYMLVYMVFSFPTDLLYGPLVWFYVRSICGHSLVWRGIQPFWHLLPWAVSAVLSIWSNLKAIRDPNLFDTYPELLLGNEIQPFLQNELTRPVIVLLMFVYLMMSLRCLRQHSEVIKNNFSYKEGVELRWLWRLLLALLAVYALYAFRFLLSEYFNIRDIVDTLVNVSIVVIIYALGFFGIRQPAVFSRLKVVKEGPASSASPMLNKLAASESKGALESEIDAQADLPSKYVKSSLSPEGAQALANELKIFMQEKEPFLENELNLPQLAALFEVSPNHLSQVINEQFEVNFFDFINQHRIEAAKQRLLDVDAKRYTILGLALDSGFNSKSAFYAAFKKYTGVTPLQFRNTQQI